MWFRLNASSWLQGTRGAPNSLTATTIQNATMLVNLKAGDYVECYVQQTTSGALNVSINDSGIGVPTTFGMEKVG